jgi:hypothetical protein
VLRTDLINFSFCRPKKPVTLKDLLPDDEVGRGGQVSTAKPRRMTAKRRTAMAETLRMVFKDLPGVKFIAGK